jgi:hypothetical protein
MRKRIAALERAPQPLTRFDRYPVAEWGAQDRPQVFGNVWSSCSIANATGLTFDRVECKFITNFLIPGEREAEIRLAAFRHFGQNEKECVSASSVLNLTGAPTVQVAEVIMRWIHGIPFGWDYDGDTSVYTIELQHRYKVGPTPVAPPPRMQVGALYKAENESDPGLLFADADGAGHWTMATTDSTPQGGWVTIPNETIQRPSDQNGSYSVSAMHYCVVLPADRLPDATTGGWAWIVGSDGGWGRAGDITEPYFQ